MRFTFAVLSAMPMLVISSTSVAFCAVNVGAGRIIGVAGFPAVAVAFVERRPSGSR